MIEVQGDAALLSIVHLFTALWILVIFSCDHKSEIDPGIFLGLTLKDLSTSILIVPSMSSSYDVMCVIHS